jgi:mannosyltransferase OCH1-like enzyme
VQIKNTYRRLRSRFLSENLSNLFLSVSDLEAIIPSDHRNVFQTWRTSSFDFEHARVIKKCVYQNPNWKFFLFLDSDMDHFMETNYGGDPILKVFQGARYMATKADIWRLCVLYKYGGLYLDIDSTVRFDLETKFNQKSELISFAGDTLENELDEIEYPEDSFFSKMSPRIQDSLLHPSHMILNWCMYFERRHPILKLALDDIRENSRHYWDTEYSDIRRAVIHLAGPMSLTRAVWRHVDHGNSVNQETFDFADMAIFKAIGRHSVYFAQEHYTVGTDKRILKTKLLISDEKLIHE